MPWPPPARKLDSKTMAILVDQSSRVMIQGITGTHGRSMAKLMNEDATTVVGGVSPGKAGQSVEGLPVFGTCHDAVSETGANCSFITVPAAHAMNVCLEAIDAGIKTITIYTENVPLRDAITICAHASKHGATVFGPNAAGCLSPEFANVSDGNERLYVRGSVGFVAKSGSLAPEVAMYLEQVGLGISTLVCLGGDPLVATGYREILELFEADVETEAVVMIGELGGRSELDAAKFLATMKTPVVATILGRNAPAGRPMGHAGALMGQEDESASAKMAVLKSAGAVIVNSITEIRDQVQNVLDN